MITRDQFEAHVRAEAMIKYPLLVAEGVADESMAAGAIAFARVSERRAYIAARMEHEWPLVEAAQAVVLRWDSPLWKDAPHTGEFIGRLRDALSPYTTKAAQ